MNQIITKGQKITSTKTGKTLLCYNVMSVYTGETITRYDYSFWDEVRRNFKTIKHSELETMLSKTWSISN